MVNISDAKNESSEEIKALTMFRSYYEVSKQLKDKDRLAYWDAIMQYGFEDKAPELEGVVKSFFVLIEPSLNKSKVKVRAGTTGGKSKTEAKPKQSKSKTEAKPKQNESKIEAKPKQNESKIEAESKQNESDKDKDKDKDKDIGLRIKDEEEDKDKPVAVPAVLHTKLQSDDFKSIKRHYEQYLGCLINPLACNQIIDFLNAGVEAGLICRAIDTSINAGARSWNYANGILNNLVASGVLTLEQHRITEANRNASKSNQVRNTQSRSSQSKPNRFANFEQRNWNEDDLKKLETAYLR